MSAQEIGVRSREAARRACERRLWRRGLASTVATDTSAAADTLLRNAALLVPGTARLELEQLKRCEPAFHDRLRQHAAESARTILSGTWSMLGHAFELRPPIDWHRDPRTAYRWPQTFYVDLPLYELPVGVDVKYVWELGRQQYLPELARAWLLAGNEDAAGLSRSILLDWIESNPLYDGIHWTSGLEVAMRSISWIWTLAALSEWSGWQRVDLQRIAASLADHARFLEHHFSFYSSPYNHLIGEATALLLIANALGDTGDALRWRDCAARVLNVHGPRQFYEDGFCVEQATGYHFYTLGFLSLAIAAARQAGCGLDRLEKVVHRAFLTGAAFRRPDGRWPEIGDVDSARSIPVHSRDFWSFDSLCQLGAVLFDECDLKRDQEDPGEETYWLCGTAGLSRWRSIDAPSRPRRVVLPQSGYVIAGDEEDWLLFDAGPVAEGLHADATPSVAHGHADVFHVMYAKGGAEVLADSGMPSYGGGRLDWTSHFRSAAAHNTVEVEGVGPVRSAGPLAWSHEEPPPTLTACLTSSSWLCSGRAVWGRGAVTIERHVCAIPGCGLWTADVIESDRPRRVRWHWHSRRDLVLCGDQISASITEASDVVPFAVWSSNGDLRFETLEPDGQSPLARLSSGYGLSEAATVLRVETIVERRMLVVTRIGTAIAFDVRCGGWVVASESFSDRRIAETSVHAHAGVCWRFATDAACDTDGVNGPFAATEPERIDLCLRGSS